MHLLASLTNVFVGNILSLSRRVRTKLVLVQIRVFRRLSEDFRLKLRDSECFFFKCVPPMVSVPLVNFSEIRRVFVDCCAITDVSAAAADHLSPFRMSNNTVSLRF